MTLELVQQVLNARATWLEKSGLPLLVTEAAWLRLFAERMGNLGEEQEEVEILPLREPVPDTVPAEQEPVPA